MYYVLNKGIVVDYFGSLFGDAKDIALSWVEFHKLSVEALQLNKSAKKSAAENA